MSLVQQVYPADGIAVPRRPVTVEQRSGSRGVDPYLPYRYGIPGIGTIGSEVRLPELAYFRDPRLPGPYDIRVRVGHIGRGGPRRRALLRAFQTPLSLSYEEHLGRLGANFQVDIGDAVEVRVSALLAHSPHVLYTNVIEALLRFQAAAAGRMLVHAACLEIDGRGVLISARTDTGKTGTVLRMMREQHGSFLSDDMTIIEPDGTARCFPKPLTISYHTLRAVQAGQLSASEMAILRLRSRLHSREGRQIGMRLADHNLPIMGFNSLTQMMVPPPKYPIDRLVPCEIADSTDVRHLFLIERGEPALHELTLEDAVAELQDNTEDAYGFPPFRYLAEVLVIGDADARTMRRKESEILTAVLGRTRRHRIASPDFSWATDIPLVLGGGLRAAGSGASRPAVAPEPLRAASAIRELAR